MGIFNVVSSLISFKLFIFCFLIGCMGVNSQSLIPGVSADVACLLVNCGQGTCTASNASKLGFDCECNPGWKKMQIGPLVFPSCVVPNCTIDFGCGSGAPPPPPPPVPPFPPPLLNISDPCALVWCGDGSCMANGTGHICNCNEGSANLLSMASLACFKECYLGADCKEQRPPLLRTPSDSTRNGSTSSEGVKWWKHRHVLTIFALGVTLFLSWV